MERHGGGHVHSLRHSRQQSDLRTPVQALQGALPRRRVLPPVMELLERPGFHLIHAESRQAGRAGMGRRTEKRLERRARRSRQTENPYGSELAERQFPSLCSRPAASRREQLPFNGRS